MSVRHATWCVCDLCGRQAPPGTDELDACRAARRAGWRMPSFDPYGNHGHVCDRCHAGRPVTLPWVPHYSPVFGARRTCPWLTPQVLSLAQAAYEERLGRECPTCCGRKELEYLDEPPRVAKFCPPPGPPRAEDVLLKTRRDPCKACHGSGRALDGSLDPVTLLALADALLESGCDSDPLLAALRAEGPHYRGFWVIDLLLGKE